MHVRFHRWVRWLAIGAVVFATLAPALANWYADARGGAIPVEDICTASGVVSLGSVAPADSEDAHHPAQHCMWCKLHACASLSAGNPGCLGGNVAQTTHAPPAEPPPRDFAPKHRPDAPRAPPAALA
ncbi:DUF2946 family protein [Rhodocyclus tenuis]|uniref:DUF2946 family protein n=1 Tax=Rhodocyclus gracilis TaxID=2929842 RepID=A0ABX0WCW3_9RHOO|nr:DUF2946 family protein [Rhodocyclus gracilis]NJA87612.1 DUF2946 family protein [Rhodocyclus gracilis]